MRLISLYICPLSNLVPCAHHSSVFIGSGVNIILQEFALDPTYNRFGLLITAPFLICVSIVSDPSDTPVLPSDFDQFFCLQVVANVSYL